MKRGLFALMAALMIFSMGAAEQLGEPIQGKPLPPREPVPTPPKAGAAAAPAESDEAIPKDTLVQMYRTELGDKFDPTMIDQLFKAHALLEQYFMAHPSQRKAIAQQIAATGVDPNIVGRIARIRLFWPALKEGVYYVNERVGSFSVIYFVGIPKNYDRTKSWPLVIKLPGAHNFVDPKIPSADEVVKMYDEWIKFELKLHPDAVVLMPLLNLDELWGPSTTGMNNVIQPLLHVCGRVNIDPKRVYMLGHAMSGHAVWNLAIHYPTYFAAINPMSGGASIGYQLPRIRNLRNIFCVVWHDADDKIVPAKLSQEVVKTLRSLKYDVDYEETNGVGHAPSDQILDRLYDKMRGRTRELYPKEVVLGSNRPELLFNRADWLQVYQQVATGKELQFRWQVGSGTVTLYTSPYKVTAKIIGPNKFQVDSENVDVMRLYVNDQMIDFSRPVTVKANNRTRFEGMVKPDMEEMLHDQVFLGRGWRYYTGYIDIDYGVTAADNMPTTRRARE